MDITENYSEERVFKGGALRKAFACESESSPGFCTAHEISLDPTPSHQTEVKQIISTLQVANLQTYLANLTAFNNRYYRVATGENATQWIIKTLTNVCLPPAPIFPKLTASA